MVVLLEPAVEVSHPNLCPRAGSDNAHNHASPICSCHQMMHRSYPHATYVYSPSYAQKQQGTFSEKDEQLRAILAKLDGMDDETGVSGLTVEDVTALRRQLHDGQNLIRETLDRLRQSQEESEVNARRRDELETRLAALETEYEELIGELAGERFPAVWRY